MPPIALIAAFMALFAATLSRYAPEFCLVEVPAAVVDDGCCFTFPSVAGFGPGLFVIEEPLTRLSYV